MWHVSIKNNGNIPSLKSIAKEQLTGVGDTERGEWEEITPNAYHLRRRVSEKEESQIGPAIDIRGTEEESWRMKKLTEAIT